MPPTGPWNRHVLATGHGDVVAFEKPGRDGLPPLVLLHGAGGNAFTWLPVEAAFADRRTILVDMPGHGESASPQSWELEEIATIVSEAVGARLGDARAIWGGHSWGGKIAGVIAGSGRAKCEGLLLVDPSPSAALPVDIDSFVDGIWSVEMQRHTSPEKAAEAARSLPHWQPWNETTAAAFRHGLAQREDGTWSLRPSREDLVALATATLHFDAGDTLAKNAGVPTLLLIAGESSAWQGITNALAYPHATQRVIPGNHWLHLCSRDAVIESASSWLNNLA
jgi:pimeloyl-ACP methyl ester carboxylesterase